MTRERFVTKYSSWTKALNDGKSAFLFRGNFLILNFKVEYFFYRNYNHGYSGECHEDFDADAAGTPHSDGNGVSEAS